MTDVKTILKLLSKFHTHLEVGQWLEMCTYDLITACILEKIAKNLSVYTHTFIQYSRVPGIAICISIIEFTNFILTGT